MKSLFTILFFFLLQIFSAQETEEIYANGVFQFDENKPQKIFTEWTRIRQSPGVDTVILDSLQTNHEILILKKEKSVLKLGERAAPWYRISYQKNGKTSEGYLWGGNLCIHYRNKNGYDFLLGLTKTLNKKNPDYEGSVQQNYASVKFLQGNILLDEASFETGSGENLNFAGLSIESGHKLKDVELTLKATTSGGACGVPTYDQYILLKSKKLIALPQLMSVGDAGAYYHSEEFVFPNDKGGIPNAFIFKMEEMEKDENDREKKKNASAVYLWNGNAYLKK
ncbi:SH3 domain-containing protein [Chryseobacterium salviniae]|uniref:SH3 domain-containing protein n=1 Tax=Chryseobacterium salviniae TaxID=3101750 RepID=A0ABU6HRH8_9FLAO|nr:SH3 domain-containing protein [Chryseobacterium sp. T9W2-O]MEC3875508.1 SH3 domain-containing protein [Chryseobacterium sp. T9W2-O]